VEYLLRYKRRFRLLLLLLAVVVVVAAAAAAAVVVVAAAVAVVAAAAAVAVLIQIISRLQFVGHNSQFRPDIVSVTLLLTSNMSHICGNL